MKKIILYTCLPILVFLAACINEKEEVIRGKLDIVLDDDLAAIIDSVDTNALLDKPYYDVLEYKEYNEGAFIRMAVVDFYFFKSLNMKVTRKYRYIRSMGLWDRYYNKYYTYTPELDEKTEN